jgi:hypothetical protein
MLRSAKDKLGCTVPSIYCILCECGKGYVDQIGCTVTAKGKEHKCHVWFKQLEKPTVAEHSTETCHKIGFSEVTVLARSTGYVDRLILMKCDFTTIILTGKMELCWARHGILSLTCSRRGEGWREMRLGYKTQPQNTSQRLNAQWRTKLST